MIKEAKRNTYLIKHSFSFHWRQKPKCWWRRLPDGSLITMRPPLGRVSTGRQWRLGEIGAYLYSDKLNGLSEGSEPYDWHRAEVFIIQTSSSSIFNSNMNVLHLQIKTIRMEQSFLFIFSLKINAYKNWKYPIFNLLCASLYLFLQINVMISKKTFSLFKNICVNCQRFSRITWWTMKSKYCLNTK